MELHREHTWAAAADCWNWCPAGSHGNYPYPATWPVTDNISSLLGNWLKMEWVTSALLAWGTGYQIAFQSFSFGDKCRLVESQVEEQGQAETGSWCDAGLLRGTNTGSAQHPVGRDAGDARMNMLQPPGYGKPNWEFLECSPNTVLVPPGLLHEGLSQRDVTGESGLFISCYFSVKIKLVFN